MAVGGWEMLCVEGSQRGMQRLAGEPSMTGVTRWRGARRMGMAVCRRRRWGLLGRAHSPSACQASNATGFSLVAGGPCLGAALGSDGADMLACGGAWAIRVVRRSERPLVWREADRWDGRSFVVGGEGDKASRQGGRTGAYCGRVGPRDRRRCRACCTFYAPLRRGVSLPSGCKRERRSGPGGVGVSLSIRLCEAAVAAKRSWAG